MPAKSKAQRRPKPQTKGNQLMTWEWLTRDYFQALKARTKLLKRMRVHAR